MAENIVAEDQTQITSIMASSLSLKAAKKELRGFMKKKLSDVSSISVNTQSVAVFKSLETFKPYQEANRIGVYLSMPSSEIQTDAIVRHALHAGKRVFVPYIHKVIDPPPGTPKSVMDMVDIRSLSDYESLKRDSWGIPTITAETVDEREHILKGATEDNNGLDMILMPGVAFDLDAKSGLTRRLGHGKGFYDYFLHRYTKMRGSPRGAAVSPESGVMLYGLALEEQLLKVEDSHSVPVGELDALLHGLLVGDGSLIAAKSEF